MLSSDDLASYPSAKISMRSPWRRKASRKKRGVPEAHSSDDDMMRGKGALQENGAPDLSPQLHASSEKNDEDDAQSSMGLTAAQSSQTGIKPDWINGQIKLIKEESSQLEATTSSLISNGEQSRDFRSALSLSSEKPVSEEEDATIAETLHTVADKFLHLDVLDQKDDARRFINYLLDTIDRLQAMAQYNQATDEEDSSCSSSDTEDDEKPVTPRGQTLHRVYCYNQDHEHDSLLFEDDPAYKGKNRVLTGQVSVPNLSFFLGRYPDICFLVMKEHNCGGTLPRRSRLRPDMRDCASERLETIQIVSPKLQKALLNVAEYHPFPVGRHATPPNQMDAPYHFFFHHRHKLEETSHEANHEDVLKPLLEWLEKNYKKEYGEAERLFADGFVTARHVSKLFKPNQMVVHRGDSDHVAAYVLSENVINKKEKLYFNGWSWEYDGHRLKRYPWDESMSMFSKEKYRISDLMIHPIDYATQKDKATLERVGRKYWAIREQTYICYTGWTVNQEHHHVSSSLHGEVASHILGWARQQLLTGFLQKNARFMVDTATYHLMHPMVHTYEIQDNVDHARFDMRPESISNHEAISSDDIMLLPTTVLGFYFNAKRWSTFNFAWHFSSLP